MLSPVGVMRVAPVEGFALSPLAVVQTCFQIPGFAKLRGAVVTICNSQGYHHAVTPLTILEKALKHGPSI